MSRISGTRADREQRQRDRQDALDFARARGRRVFDAEGTCVKGHTHFARAESEEGVLQIVKDAIDKCQQNAQDSGLKASEEAR